MGKVVIAFLFFIAASTLAIREARPLSPPPPAAAPVEAVVNEPPSRAVHDAVPPWVRYAPPPQPAPPQPPVEQEAVVTLDNDSGDDIPDVVDRCPDQPDDNADNDGCPEPEYNGPVTKRIIKIELIY